MKKVSSGILICCFLLMLMFSTCVGIFIVSNNGFGYSFSGVIDDIQSNDKLDQAYSSYENNKYDECIKLSKEVISESLFPEDITNANNLIIHCVRRISGCNEALKQAHSMRDSVALERPDNKDELACYDEIISLLKAECEVYAKSNDELVNNINSNPESELLELKKCKLEEMYGGYQSAISSYQKLYLKSSDANIRHKTVCSLSRIYSYINDNIKARTLLSDAIANSPDNIYKIELIIKRNRLSTLDTNENSDAIKYLRDLDAAGIKERKTEYGSAIALNIGMLLGKQGMSEESLLAYNEAIKRNSNNKYSISALNNIGNMHLLLKQPGVAIERMRYYESNYPNSEIAIFAKLFIARIYLCQDELALAENEYLSILEKQPFCPYVKGLKMKLMNIYIEKAESCESLKDTSGAALAWEKAFKYSNETHRKLVFSFLASNLLSLNRYDDIHKYAHLISLDCKTTEPEYYDDIKYYDAMAYYLSGDLASALPILKDIVSNTKIDTQKEALGSLIIDIEQREVH